MKKWLRSILLLLLFAGFTVAMTKVDVAAVGPNGTSVGFSHINDAVHKLLGYNDFWYSLTQITGYLSLAVAAGFGLAGLVQLLRRKNLFAVDADILGLGVLFILTLVLYVLFEKLTLNYRPVIMPGELEPEASYPSSHTMLVCVVMGGTVMTAHNRLERGFLRGLITAVCGAVLLLTVAGRLLSGVHWFTDIIGGVLLSAALLSLLDAALSSLFNSVPEGRYLQK